MAAKASEGAEASFIEHLLELRTRILRSAIAVLVLFVGLFPFRNTLYRLLARPLTAVLPQNGAMIATNLPATFIAPLKLALATAVAVAIPYILYQAWAFVAPGLYQRERRLVTPLLVSSTLLFYLGMAFAYFLIFPLAFGFFAHAAPAGVRVMTDINHYLNFVLTLFFAFGLAFEVPVAIVLLVLMGVLRPETLSGKRRYVILGAFVLAAIITPPDAFSQTVLALAMWALFEAGLFVAYRIRPQSSSVELTEPTPPPTPVIPPPREITPQSRPRRRRRRTRKPPPPGGGEP
ncbi:twin-arginine translocase subunit TatC [Acidiferrobacter thiooxydans]|jgi:sec-independent protein translocase protein TatC|uniref:Sec-independent protein translocase protein TatC n=1 Tax=Acidiferrobacter thiooxydans TaxID=163359 RepID=A0A1C2G3I7_9GAMM|nr:twin-arginine translocase subunit TatC [Acidiferrobacter thiooxydans]RCN56681.1 twin-arginine translocase subunit TatC [Acidiferrobacter thiooxydans]UEN99350.1 twin-arginine translocase subunit TatC [Acidiferrobacter thiooxydans]